jgi:hypothetical protein
MEDNKNITSLIGLIVNENLAQAKTGINDELNRRLASALEAKFDEYAPTLFEKWDAEKADKNKDGEVSDWEKASTEWASKGDSEDVEETEDEEQSEEKEESESEDQEDEEADSESEEDEEEKD